MVKVREKAPAVIRWQPAQWQAEASSGGALTRSRVRPQRQPPSHGSFHSLILILLALISTFHDWRCSRFRLGQAPPALHLGEAVAQEVDHRHPKKVASLLGIPLATPDSDEEP
jgi:hypothetical protein